MALYSSSIIPVYFLFVATCTSNENIEGRIVGGSYAKIDQFPHSVYLFFECKEYQWICGASIVNQRILLTAGHCLDGCVKKWTITAYAGHEFISKIRLVRKVKKYMIHRNYESRTSDNDIGVAYIASNLPLGKTVKRVILTRNFPAALKDVQVAGWGLLADGSETDKLKSVPQRLQNARDCKVVGKLSGGMMCAWHTKKDYPNMGDSGSALMSNKAEQIGLVSFKAPNQPHIVVYTNVSYFYEWIMDCSQKLYCSG